MYKQLANFNLLYRFTVKALETMLFTIDRINPDLWSSRGFTLGAHILDDCDKDTYGLEQAVAFIKGNLFTPVQLKHRHRSKIENVATTHLALLCSTEI